MGGCVPGSATFDDMARKPDFKLAMVQFQAMQLTETDVRRLFRVFEKVDQDHSNSIGLAEFLAHIDLQRTAYSERIFTIFDKDNSGAIDFREFVLSVWNYCTLSKIDLDIFAFDLYDTDGSGSLSPSEVLRLIQDIFGKHEMKSNVHAKSITLELNSYDAAHKQFTAEMFHHFMLNHQAMVFPAIQIQQALRKKILGNSFWERQSERRRKQCNGKYISINEYLEKAQQKWVDTGHETAVTPVGDGSFQLNQKSMVSINSRPSNPALNAKPSASSSTSSFSSFSESAKQRFNAGVKGVQGIFTTSGKHKKAKSANKVYASVNLVAEGFGAQPSTLSKHGSHPVGQPGAAGSHGHTHGHGHNNNQGHGQRHSPGHDQGHTHGHTQQGHRHSKRPETMTMVFDVAAAGGATSPLVSPGHSPNKIQHSHSHGHHHNNHHHNNNHHDHSSEPVIRHFSVVEIADMDGTLSSSNSSPTKTPAHVSAANAAQIAEHLKKRHKSGH